jgi:hypothetical protein
VISTQPSDVNECVGGTNTMTVTVTGGSGAITINGSKVADGSTGWANSTGSGATTATYTPSSAVPEPLITECWLMLLTMVVIRL